MNYQQSWAYLDSLQFHKIKLGLEAMRSFMGRVGNPEHGLKIVHVAGTNGKGSVCVTLLTLLARAGYRVGLYTSPHLSSVRERFRVNDNFISELDFARIATGIKEVLGDEKITYFEFTTALAFIWFAEQELDLVILETGLGGRLDATNIIKPLVSVITNVSLDHEAYLGDTIPQVAREKAGIIKPSVPVVSAVREGQGLFEVKAACVGANSPLYLYGHDFKTILNENGSWNWYGGADWSGHTYDSLRCVMRGDYQIENASLALAVLELLKKHHMSVSDENVRDGLAKVRWPGRLEFASLKRNLKHLNYLIDGAHNPDGVKSLVRTLDNEKSRNRLIVIWGAMADKDLKSTIPMIARLADHLIFTKPDGERSASPESLMAYVPDGLISKCVKVPRVEDALLKAEQLSEPDDLVLIAGSLYLVGAIRKILLGELVG